MNILFKYLKESKEEFKKVTWPTKKATINYSLLVIAISIFLAIFIGLSDFILNSGLEKIVDITASTPQVQKTNTKAPNFQVGDVQVKTDKQNTNK